MDIFDPSKSLDGILMASPSVLYAVPLDGKTGATYVSPNIEHVLGFEVSECLGDPNWWINHLHPNDLGTADWACRQIEIGCTEFSHEYRMRHNHGHYIWVHDQVRVVTSKIGEPIGLVGSWLDITKNIELQELSSSAQLLDFTAFGIIGLNSKKNVIYTNAKAKSIISSRDGIHVEREKVQLRNENDAKTFDKALEDILKQRQEDVAAFQIRRPSCKKPYGVVLIASSLLPFSIASLPVSALCLIHDVEMNFASCGAIISNIYGLTKSEGNLVAHLTSGFNLKEAAAKLDITEGSARIYLKNIFHKTGTRSQMELLRMVLSGPAVIW